LIVNASEHLTKIAHVEPFAAAWAGRQHIPLLKSITSLQSTRVST
jgi:hypothetical protein